jgi:hypothetical protein
MKLSALIERARKEEVIIGGAFEKAGGPDRRSGGIHGQGPGTREEQRVPGCVGSLESDPCRHHNADGTLLPDISD